MIARVAIGGGHEQGAPGVPLARERAGTIAQVEAGRRQAVDLAADQCASTGPCRPWRGGGVAKMRISRTPAASAQSLTSWRGGRRTRRGAAIEVARDRSSEQDDVYVDQVAGI